MKYLLAIFLLVHGLIHLMGFFKAFQFMEISQLKNEISRPEGLLWLLSALLFLAAIILLLVDAGWWWMIALAALLISQGLVISTWSDAKFGTVANAIVLLAVVAGFGNWQFERKFRKDVEETFRKAGNPSTTLPRRRPSPRGVSRSLPSSPSMRLANLPAGIPTTGTI
jgi:hypothetical protein